MTATTPTRHASAESDYLAGRLYAERVLLDPELPSMKAIVYAQNRQGEFARGFDDRLGGAAKEMLRRLREAGATL